MLAFNSLLSWVRVQVNANIERKLILTVKIVAGVHLGTVLELLNCKLSSLIDKTSVLMESWMSRFLTGLFEGPYQCYYMSLSFVSISHSGHINPTHFPQNSFLYKISCLFTVCLFWIYIADSTWKCLTMLVKKKICVKALLIWARRAKWGAVFFQA